jgi:excisionase family DNA binding protein
VEELESLVHEWLTLPDVAERLGVDVGKVRRMVQEGHLIAVRRGERNVASVPAELLGPEGLMPELRGTVTVLADAGYEGPDALRWLFTPDDSIVGGSPIAALHAGHKTEVRRRAQALAV